MRSRLVAILRRAALDAGARIVTAERLVGMRETPDGVTVEFASGHSDTAELLVGADGIHSTVRGLLDPSAPRAEYAGLYGVAGISTIKNAEVGIWNGTMARNGVFVHSTVDDQTAWWAAQVADPVKSELRGVDEAQWRRRLPDLFPEPVPSAILAATTQILAATHMYACDPIRTWHGDRVVLIGGEDAPAAAVLRARSGIPVRLRADRLRSARRGVTLRRRRRHTVPALPSSRRRDPPSAGR